MPFLLHIPVVQAPGKVVGLVFPLVQVGAVRRAQRLGFQVRGDYGLGVYNSQALKELKRLGLLAARRGLLALPGQLLQRPAAQVVEGGQGQ